MPLAAMKPRHTLKPACVPFTEGKYDEAVTALAQAITSYPHYAQAHYMLGNTYYQQQNYAQARQAFERAVTSYPGAPRPTTCWAQRCTSKRSWRC